jgi:hypothetical protein
MPVIVEKMSLLVIIEDASIWNIIAIRLTIAGMEVMRSGVIVKLLFTLHVEKIIDASPPLINVTG